MIRSEGGSLRVSGPLTMETVPDLVGAIDPYCKAGATTIDFSEVTEVDSAAVALTLEWQRIALANKVTLELKNLPASMLNLAKLYGVSEIIQPH
ncbi:MAG: lipid asymmetry maintenance protein MlaB [Burkholderiales bacterium]